MDTTQQALGQSDSVVESLFQSYRTVGESKDLETVRLPSMEHVTQINASLMSIIFPGFRIASDERADRLRACIGEHVSHLRQLLAQELDLCLQFRDRARADSNSHEGGRAIADEMLALLPELRRRIYLDIDAAYRGDPAAKSRTEVVLAYPCIEAILVYRFAHELWRRAIPLIPRMMSEQAHSRTGIDIHPGAKIGAYFFIDHATGVVIGETTLIGANVKIYQGVTLGALSIHKQDADMKRHPTIEDDVTIYSGATILGGDTVIGRGSIIGGNVWVTQSVAPGSKIYYHQPL